MIKRTWYELMLGKNDKASECGFGDWDLDNAIEFLRILQKVHEDAYIAIYVITYADYELGIPYSETRIGEYHLCPIG